METPEAAVIRAFVRCINARDAGGLARLMTDDHTFTDSLGAQVVGKEAMRTAWVAYFFLIPDYTIAVQTMVQAERTFAVFGTARGTCAVDGHLSPEDSWEIPLAIRAVVRDALVAEWQVFADNEPVRSIMSRQAARNTHR